MSAKNTVKALLKEYPELIEIPDNKLKCSLSGHEMSRDVKAIELYVGGPKFKRLRTLHDLMEKYGEYFGEVGRTGELFCKVTCRSVARDGKTLQRHINGSRFKKGLSKYLASLLEETQEKSSEHQKGTHQVYGEDGQIPSYSKIDKKSRKFNDAKDTVEVHAEEEEENLTDDMSSLSDVESDKSSEGDYPELAEDNESEFDWKAMDTEVENVTISHKRAFQEPSDSTQSHKRFKEYF